jgi:GNAT superfamily N-acetyltransferase
MANAHHASSLSELGLDIRPVQANDVDALRRLFSRLSPRTVYLRFFQPIMRPSDARLRYLAGVDHHAREAIAALQYDGEIVGVARYDVSHDDPTRAEVAVLVEDAWQGRGVGPMLLRALTRAARCNGVEAFTASVLAENRHMLTVMHELAGRGGTHSHMTQGEWEVEIPVR